jgi:glycine hydroxymethyltransferase
MEIRGKVLINVSAPTPYGIRIGTPAVTTRGMKENDMVIIADLYDRVISVAKNVNCGDDMELSEFISKLKQNDEILKLRREVELFALKFDLPGVERPTSK